MDVCSGALAAPQDFYLLQGLRFLEGPLGSLAASSHTETSGALRPAGQDKQG
jgi:hypothetical protein